MHWPDPPMCCAHGVNTHGRERCQAPLCGCDKETYLAQRQAVLRQRAAAEQAPPPTPAPEIDWRWRIVARLDGTLEIEINKALFGDGDDGAGKALAEVTATAAELGQAKPAEVDDV